MPSQLGSNGSSFESSVADMVSQLQTRLVSAYTESVRALHEEIRRLESGALEPAVSSKARSEELCVASRLACLPKAGRIRLRTPRTHTPVRSPDNSARKDRCAEAVMLSSLDIYPNKAATSSGKVSQDAALLSISGCCSSSLKVDTASPQTNGAMHFSENCQGAQIEMNSTKDFGCTNMLQFDVQSDPEVTEPMEQSLSMRVSVETTSEDSQPRKSKVSSSTLRSTVPGSAVDGSGWIRASHEHAIDEIVDLALSAYRLAQPSWLERLFMSPEARLAVLEHAMSVIIMINVVTMGVSADFHPHSSSWLVVDAVFVALFLFELVIKLCTQGMHYFHGRHAKWNMFDTFLTAFAIVELSVASGNLSLAQFRMLRLIRISKIARLGRLHIFAELLVMLNGMKAGAKTFCWSLMLLGMPLYVLALVLREAVVDAEDGGEVDTEVFSSLGDAWFTMFRCMVAGDCSNEDGKPIFVLLVKHHSGLYGLVYAIGLSVTLIGILNVISAMFVEAVMESGRRNQSMKRQRKLMDHSIMVEAIQELLVLVWELYYGRNLAKRDRRISSDLRQSLEEASDISLDHDLFQELCLDKRFHHLLSTLDIPFEDRQDMFDTLDVDRSGVIDVKEFIGGLSYLRGEPRRSDTVNLRLMLRQLQRDLQEIKDVVSQPSSTGRQSG